MEISFRDLITVLHGMGFGALFMLAFSGAIGVIYATAVAGTQWTAPSTVGGAAACLDYSVYLFDAGAMNLQAILAPTMSFQPGRGLRYSVAMDDQPAKIVDAWESNKLSDWETAVSDGVHKVTTRVNVAQSGRHTVHFCRVDAGVVLEKLVLTKVAQRPAGAPGPPVVPASAYLGPPESVFRAVAAGGSN